MINVQTVVDRITSILDAEGSDRYLFDQDFKPAINTSIEWLISVFNKAFADKKLTEEDLRELINTQIWQANEFSRVKFDSAVVGSKLWSILKVMLEPVVDPPSPLNPLPSSHISIFRDDVSFISSIYSAKRLTSEQWEGMKENIFEAGNQTLTNKLKSYAYRNFSNYSAENGTYTGQGAEIEISPLIPDQYVAIEYLRYPDVINDLSDSISFPESLVNLVSQKAANIISFKQGDKTNLHGVTAAEVQTLVQLMV